MMILASSLASPEVPAIAPAPILHCADPSHGRAAVRERLLGMGLAVRSAATIAEALRCLAHDPFTLCLVDLADDRVALPLIRAIRTQYPAVVIAGIIDPARPLASAEAIQAGAVDLLPWPFEERDVAEIVANARDAESLSLSPAGATPGPNSLIAHSPSMRVVMNTIRAAASLRTGVLISGQPGTGRELVARAIHALGPAAEGPFVVVDCTEGSPDQLEQILFGVVDHRRPTRVRTPPERVGAASAVAQALGGTLLLSHVADAADRVQVRLARLLRDREAVLGDTRKVVEADVRLMGTVDGPPDPAVADGSFRRDLHDRLALTRIDLPGLRRRREDIPFLADHFVDEIACAQGLTPPRFTRAALALLAALPWPGNANELRIVLDTLVRWVRRPVIELEDVLEHVQLDGGTSAIEAAGTLRDARARFERDWISAVLVKHHGRVGDAARALGIQRTNLYRKVRQLKVERTLIARRS